MRKVGVFLACFAICSQLMSVPAAAHSSVVQDPEGDIASGIPAYYDIVKAKVHAADSDDAITFSMRVAADIPSLSATTFLAANWILDTDPSRTGPEYNVVVRWCSRATHPACQLGPAHWEAAIRDLHTAALTFLPDDSLSVDGRDISVRVSQARLGNATEFLWFSASRTQPAQSAPATDTAPDTGPLSFRK